MSDGRIFITPEQTAAFERGEDIHINGKTHRIVEGKIQPGDLYWFVVTGCVIDIYHDVDYGDFEPNDLGASKVIQL